MDYVLKIKKSAGRQERFPRLTTRRASFGTYPEEGMTMLGEGVAPAIIENVGRMAGMPMGPLEVSRNSVGIDTMLKIGREAPRLPENPTGQNPVGDLVAWIVDTQNRVGRKAGKGFYDYNEAGKPSRLYPDIGKKIDIKTKEMLA